MRGQRAGPADAGLRRLRRVELGGENRDVGLQQDAGGRRIVGVEHERRRVEAEQGAVDPGAGDAAGDAVLLQLDASAGTSR